MKGKVLQENLAKALQIANRFVSVKAQLPILGNILFEAKKNKVLISATNLELSISLSLGAQIAKEGKLSLPAKNLTDFVVNLPKGTINFEAEKEQLKLESENFNSTFSGMDPSDFPEIPATLAKEKMKLPSEDLLFSLSQVLFSVSTDETRPVLTGVLILFKEDSIVFVATDGFRLSQKKIKIKKGERSISETKLILPKNALAEITRLAGGEEEISLSLQKEENQAIFEVDNQILTSRVIEGEFPDFEKIIPKETKLKVNVDKEDFLRAVKLASVFARDSANVIKLSFTKSSLEIEAESAQSGSQKGSVEAKTEGEVEKDFVIAFNYRFIEDFLGAVKGDDINIELNDANSPGVFTDPKDPDYLPLIMPVKLTT